VDGGKRVSRVAYTAFDDFGPKRLPTLAVQVGDRVRLGQPLTRRKAYPEVVGTAPASGVVEAINRGARRSLETIVIRLDPAPDSVDADGVPDRDQETFNRYRTDQLAGLTRTQVRENLIAAGLWLAFRTRPFSMIPPPDSVPDALFVTAMDTRPLAADPAPLIRAAGGDFAAGLRLLSRLTDGSVYVCTRPDAGLPMPDDPPSKLERSGSAHAQPPAPPRIRTAEFAGPHPAGLPGTHIHFLRPASLTHMVWHIGWQDVIAIGRLFLTGRIDPTRSVALCGPMVARPRILCTRLGASTNELIAGELAGPREARVISGSALNGRHAVGTTAFLGRFHNQLTVLAEEREREWLGWMKPGRGRYSALNLFWPRGASGPLALGTSLRGSPRAMVPVGAYEQVMPLDLLPVPLLRALLVDDIETAEALGALELDEEDLSLLAFVDCGKHDYGRALRRNLEAIRREHDWPVRGPAPDAAVPAPPATDLR
jgi:Na+-transporting NADH:ubiquinone oxidoreductase subunit A